METNESVEVLWVIVTSRNLIKSLVTCQDCSVYLPSPEYPEAMGPSSNLRPKACLRPYYGKAWGT
jgi:hypothetical protein